MQCQGGVCPIHVPGPSAAVIFLTSSMYQASEDGHPSETFATSHTTHMHNTAAVDGLSLETSNGLDAQGRLELKGSSTSSGKGMKNAACSIRIPKGMGVLLAVIVSATIGCL